MQLLACLGPQALDRPALVRVGDRHLSSSELAEAVGAVATRLGGPRVVAVEASATLETVVAVLGALAVGATVVPVPADAGRSERRHILADSAATAILAAATAERPPGGEDLTLLPVDVDERAPLRVVEHPTEAPALILYTSGTTGPPKGVPVTGAAIAACLDGLGDAWAWTADDVVAHGLPLFHVHGLVLGVLGPLHHGGRMVHTGRPGPPAYAAAVHEAGATMLFGVPTVWSRLVADPTACAALRPARLIVSGSAPLPASTFDGLAAGTGQQPVERYGMTETLITLSIRAAGERRRGWVGPALPGVETRLRADDGGPVAADGESIGDLEVRGPTVMAGYLHQAPDAPAVFAEDGWFRTGDVATLDSGGYHRLIGRNSTDLVKSGGYRIGTGEVEDALLAHPGVREAAVVGVPDDDLGAVLVAHVVAEGVGGDELIAFVAAELAVHKRPRRVELVDSLPRNAMGKVDKKALSAP